MNKLKLITGAAVVAMLLAPEAFIAHAGSKKVFADDFNKKKDFEKNWTVLNTDNPGTVALIPDSENQANRIVAITSADRTAKGVRKVLTGLKPKTLYRLSARVRTIDVTDGRGAVLYINPRSGDEQPWNASEFVYGTSGWKEVYMDFVSDLDGKAEIALALGFPWGTVNGGTARGTACWDDVTVTEVAPEALKRREGRHIALAFDPEKVTVSDGQLDTWLSKLDMAYDSYHDLVGDVPYDGRTITIITTPGIEPGYWALAGNPILWNSHVAVSDLLDKTVRDDDWGFGIIHEIGHVFSAGTIGKSGNWNWNDEIFANFRMSYALEKCGGTVSQRNTLYKGAKVEDYYKIFYDETLGAGKPTANGDALHYTFLRIKDRYGWDVYKKAFRSLYALGENDIAGNASDFDKLMFFLSHVSKAAGEDVVAATYTPQEIELIKQGMSR